MFLFALKFCGIIEPHFGCVAVQALFESLGRGIVNVPILCKTKGVIDAKVKRSHAQGR